MALSKRARVSDKKRHSETDGDLQGMLVYLWFSPRMSANCCDNSYFIKAVAIGMNGA